MITGPKKRHHRSDTGDHSRGSSSLPSGRMQISLHDGNKTEWVKWVKFGLAHRERMKAASELREAERPKPNASIDIEQFHDAVTFLRAVDRRIPEETARQAISLISSARLLQDFELSMNSPRHMWSSSRIPMCWRWFSHFRRSLGSICHHPSKGFNITPGP